MQIHEVMTSAVWSVEADTTLGLAARLMAKAGIGALPVLDGNCIVGIVTARDIAVRGAAQALAVSAPVSAVMTEGIYTCHPAEAVADVLLEMELLQVRRMPVEDDHDRIVGMVSLSDLAAACDAGEARRARDLVFDQPVVAA